MSKISCEPVMLSNQVKKFFEDELTNSRKKIQIPIFARTSRQKSRLVGLFSYSLGFNFPGTIFISLQDPMPGLNPEPL